MKNSFILKNSILYDLADSAKVKLLLLLDTFFSLQLYFLLIFHLLDRFEDSFFSELLENSIHTCTRTNHINYIHVCVRACVRACTCIYIVLFNLFLTEYYF